MTNFLKKRGILFAIVILIIGGVYVDNVYEREKLEDTSTEIAVATDGLCVVVNRLVDEQELNFKEAPFLFAVVKEKYPKTFQKRVTKAKISLDEFIRLQKKLNCDLQGKK